MSKNISIKNRKARFNYEVIDRFTAGIVLKGTEIKSLRTGQASIAESFCEFSNN
ncbi:MAG TPA: SsrA-binding protein, partial [Flavobacteriaceae bacterium]|nr:SsrA-binding protein [Flavobacteriaceae bacterium]